MPEPIKAMERKRERNQELRRNLQCCRPRRKRRCQSRRIQMPPESRRCQVRESEDVEAARERSAGQAVGDGEDRCYLPFVDREMGCCRTEFALRDEDVVGGGGGLTFGLLRVCLN